MDTKNILPSNFIVEQTPVVIPVNLTKGGIFKIDFPHKKPELGFTGSSETQSVTQNTSTTNTNSIIDLDKIPVTFKDRFKQNSISDRDEDNSEDTDWDGAIDTDLESDLPFDDFGHIIVRPPFAPEGIFAILKPNF